MTPRLSVSSPLPRLSAFLSLLFLAVLGCARQSPNAPAVSTIARQTGSALAAGPNPAGAYFPLQIGNRWQAKAESRARLTPSNGGPVEEQVILSDITRLLIGTETLSGTDYVVQQDSTIQSSRPGEPFV